MEMHSWMRKVPTVVSSGPSGGCAKAKGGMQWGGGREGGEQMLGKTVKLAHNLGSHAVLYRPGLSTDHQTQQWFRQADPRERR